MAPPQGSSRTKTKPRILDCHTCSSGTLWQDVLQVPWEPLTNNFISYHASAWRADPGVLHHWHQTPASATPSPHPPELLLTLPFTQGILPYFLLMLFFSKPTFGGCSCPVHSNYVNSNMSYSNSPAAPGWGSVEGPLWPHCCSVPLLLLFLSFISLLFLLLSSLFWYQIPLTAPCKVSTAPSSVPEGSCTAWAEPHWLQQCPAANSIAYLHCKHNYLITKETGAAITEPLLDLLFWSISWCWNYKSWCKLVV